METAIWIYAFLFIAGAVINIVRGFAEGTKFAKYMEEHYPEQWQRLLYEQLPGKIMLGPFGRGNVIEFVWKSNEDYGDPKIRLFRQRLRWAFYGWLIYVGAGVLGFGILGIITYY